MQDVRVEVPLHPEMNEQNQEDSEMAKKETHIPAVVDTAEALEAKIAAM